MTRSDVIYLVTETPGGHGAFDKVSREERMVYCRVKSVTSADFWRAYENGVSLSLVFVLADRSEYQGERLVRHGDRYFQIVRTYDTGKGFELTCKEADAYDGDPESGAEEHRL